MGLELIIKWIRLLLLEFLRSIQWTMEVVRVRCNHIIQVRSSNRGINNNLMEEAIHLATTNSSWKRTKTKISLGQTSQVTKAAYRNKRICPCGQVLLSKELIAKTRVLTRIKPVVVRRRLLPILIQHTIGLGQLQSNNSKVIVMWGLSTQEWWQLIKCKVKCILLEPAVALIFKSIKTNRDQAPAKSTPA